MTLKVWTSWFIAFRRLRKDVAGSKKKKLLQHQSQTLYSTASLSASSATGNGSSMEGSWTTNWAILSELARPVSTAPGQLFGRRYCETDLTAAIMTRTKHDCCAGPVISIRLLHRYGSGCSGEIQDVCRFGRLVRDRLVLVLLICGL